MRFPRGLALLAFSSLILTGCVSSTTDQAAETQQGSATSSSPGNSQSPQTSATATPSPASPSPAEVLGGGQEIFAHRYVALYGTPGTPSLGVLGEQGPAESVARVKQLVAQYQPLSKETVLPAFEVIVTTASSAPGPDGDYSDMAEIAALRPLIEEAKKNDVYVILDFQPGRSTFTEQVKAYEELLKEPNVGLGLDPEWRLYGNQVHLQQIGTVDASEINEALDYLSNLTEKNNLPQKMVVLHQFTHSMITNRDSIDTGHKNLALTLHADGHGTPELKDSTYQELIRDLNPAIVPSWKNFYDEDTPMLTPEQTYALVPQPYVVTYQ